MGKRAREIIRVNMGKLLKDLTGIYADEWIAHYQYSHLALTLRGIDADTLRGQLVKQSQGELEHAEKIAKRIVQLGGSPPAAMEALTKLADCKPRPPPSDQTDLEGAIKFVLDTERCAIDVYNRLLAKYRNTDHVTYEMVEDLLIDELEEEEVWENFLAKV